MKLRVIMILVLLALIAAARPVVGAEAQSAGTSPDLNSTRYVLMWQVLKDATDADLEFLKSKGVNLIQAFMITNWGDAVIHAYLDRAKAHGLGVVFSLGRLMKNEGGRYSFGSEAAYHIDKWKTHPAVFAWHTIDEPANLNRRISIEDQVAMYKFVKSRDPSHPVFVDGNWTTLEHYQCCFTEDAFDILDIHAYGVVPGSRQLNLIKQFRAHRTRDYPLIITLLAFGTSSQPFPSDSLERQYVFFFKKNRLTQNIGFYGWHLNPDKNYISNDPDIKRQFVELKF